MNEVLFVGLRSRSSHISTKQARFNHYKFIHKTHLTRSSSHRLVVDASRAGPWITKQRLSEWKGVPVSEATTLVSISVGFCSFGCRVTLLLFFQPAFESPENACRCESEITP